MHNSITKKEYINMSDEKIIHILFYEQAVY